MTTTEIPAHFIESIETGRTFTLGEQSHRSRSGYKPCLASHEYGKIIERLGMMARRGDKMAYIAQQTIGQVNLYGDRAQACAAVFAAFGQAVREGDYFDVIGATGPEASRPSAHRRPWTLADKIIARAWVNVIIAGLTGSVDGHGWALVALAEREGITLPTV